MVISVHLLRKSDLPAADKIFRLAFGTFEGLPDPLTFGGDTDCIRTRWLADPTAAFVAEVGGEPAGSVFVTRWGSVGFFGPLTVRPDLWDQGIAKSLLDPVMELFTTWKTRHAGLYTYAQSPKHTGLYQKYGFWPRFLTALMSKPVEKSGQPSSWSRYSEVTEAERAGCLRACRALTDAVYDGLDLEREIHAVSTQKLGDTVLLWDKTRLNGLAVCHCGPGTEAGSGVCYIKFGAVQPGPTAGQAFTRLLQACEALAAKAEVSRLVVGVNTARNEAFRKMMDYGFRTFMQGVVMQRPNEPAYNRPGVYVIDDWR